MRLFGLAIEFDHDLDKMNDRIAAGTSVAIAMGGATFLPDKAYNLSSNVGFYDGAWAGAINFSALVSQSAAINAGLGYGFNKGGKLGARVGFTYGW